MGQFATLVSPGPGRDPKRAVILLTSPGRRVALVNTLRTVANSLNVDLRILACDKAPRKCPACLLADAAYQTPAPQDPNYIDSLLQICLIHRVTLVLPTDSAELAPLSRSRDRFAGIGSEIAISSPEIVELISDPQNVEALLCARGFGEAGAGTRPDEQEGSRRFDVLMYFDQQDQLRATIPCERIVEEGDEVLVTRRCAAITATAEQISRRFNGLGSIVSMDVTLRSDGSVTVERIRAYLSESFEVAHRAGAEIIKWLLMEHCFGPTTISDEWQDGVQMIRYQAAVFVLPK